jgi:tellurite resistance protein TerA
MKTIIQGQRVKLDELTNDLLLKVEINLSFTNTQSISVDISCFGVDAQNQLSDDQYMIFYNQKQSPCGAISIVNDTHQNSHTFQVDIKKLPLSIHKLVFTATIDGSGTMKDLGTGEITLSDHTGIVAQFEFDKGNLNQEKALIIAEIYLKGQWRFAAIAQGFNEGLSALLKHFGGEESVHKTSSPAPQSSSRSKSTPSKPSPSLNTKVSLSKVTLKKKGDTKSISLEKSANAKNIIHINLNWDAPKPKKFSFLGSNTPPDLDLGCMFRLKDGNMGVIQPLGNFLGSSHQPPYILLDKDDRSGSSATGENLRIYKPELIDFVMIFAMIYQGAKNFTTVNGRITVTDQKGNEVYIKLDSPDPRYTFCSVCTFKNTGTALDLKKEELYFSGHPEADKHFGFGFSWKKGSK